MTSDSEEGIIRWRDLPKEMPFSSPSVKKVTDSVELKKKKKKADPEISLKCFYQQFNLHHSFLIPYIIVVSN